MPNLVKRSNGNSQIVKESRQQSAVVIANMLDRAASRASKELTEQDTEDWLEALEREPGPAIRWAFMEHMKLSEFFPKPAEILRLVSSWKSVTAQEQADQQKAEEKADRERRIASGEKFYGWADAVAEFKKVIEAKPNLTREKRQELQKRLDDLRKGNRKSA